MIDAYKLQFSKASASGVIKFFKYVNESKSAATMICCESKKIIKMCDRHKTMPKNVSERDEQSEERLPLAAHMSTIRSNGKLQIKLN